MAPEGACVARRGADACSAARRSSSRFAMLFRCIRLGVSLALRDRLGQLLAVVERALHLSRPDRRQRLRGGEAAVVF